MAGELTSNTFLPALRAFSRPSGWQYCPGEGMAQTTTMSASAASAQFWRCASSEIGENALPPLA